MDHLLALPGPSDFGGDSMLWSGKHAGKSFWDVAYGDEADASTCMFQLRGSGGRLKQYLKDSSWQKRRNARKKRLAAEAAKPAGAAAAATAGVGGGQSAAAAGGGEWVMDPLDPPPQWVKDGIAGKYTLPAHRAGNPLPTHKRCVMPPDRCARLYSYQREGIEWGVRKQGRVLIGDEMGLGKTVQGIGIALRFSTEWPLLVVCPASLRFVWVQELQQWADTAHPLNGFHVHMVSSGNDHIITPSSGVFNNPRAPGFRITGVFGAGINPAAPSAGIPSSCLKVDGAWTHGQGHTHCPRLAALPSTSCLPTYYPAPLAFNS
jgi:hypothetical protein